MRKLSFSLAVFLLTVSLIGCMATLTPIQRRSFEVKDLEGKFDDALKATLQVFQDYGYIIKSSDYKSGVIQGETGIRRDFLGNMTNFEITATLEQFGENTVRERLMLIKKQKINSEYGIQEDSRIIEDPELFRKIYDDIQKEIFIRKNLNR